MDCIFCKIAEGQLPSNKVYEDADMIAFRDINPQAKIHVLVIPKTHIESFDAIDESNIALVSRLIKKIPEIARMAGVTNGYRVISNCGSDACQTVHHLHFHILGGEQLADRMA